MTEFEKCLRYGRKDKKMTQQQLADMAGLERTDIVKLESGFFVPVDEATLRRIASMTGTDEQMFLMMYRFVFSRELRQGAPATPAMSAAEEEKQKEDLPPELVSLSHSIMALPAEKKDGLVRAIQEMMQVFCPA